MKISYRWLQEFVETDLAPRAIAERLINAGIEVASITPVVEGLAGVVIAEIEAIEQDLGATASGHHNKLCRVRLPDRAFSVICGAPNAEPGVRAAFAPPGATLPRIGAITTTTIRGVASEGMLCSEKELGLSDDHAGILVLPGDAPLGTDLATYLGLDDWILEIEITPEPARCAVGRRGCPRDLRAHRRALSLPAGRGEGGRRGCREPREHPDRGPGSVSAIRRSGHHRADRRAHRRRGSRSGCARSGFARSTTSWTSPTT